MGKICLQRGVYDMLGPKEDLAYCFKCMLLNVRHSSAIPKTKDGTILNWLCDQCESETGGNGFVNNCTALSGSRAGVTFTGLSREGTQPVSYAEPLIRSVWTGMFDMLSYDEPTFRVMHDVQAFLSSKACKKVHEAAALLGPALWLQMEPREKVWPKGFINGPTDDSIAVYFFSSLAKQESYDKLVFEMLSDDLAMLAFVGDAELLIFPSTVLPPRFWRFQGRLFLWGVFRGKQVAMGGGIC